MSASPRSRDPRSLEPKLAAGIDRSAPTSLYTQIEQRITALIADGTFHSGQRLPAEREMCRRLGVSRVTLRRALEGLVARGLLVASPQRGWFVATVANVMSEPPNALQSFTETGRELGLAATSEVLAQIVRAATIEEADQLRIAPGADVFCLERLRLLGSLPVALHRARVPLELAPDLTQADFTVVSLYEQLEAAGHPPVRGDCDVRVEMPDDRERVLLGPVPLLVVRQTSYDPRMTPVELSEMRYRGDRYRLQTSLHRSVGPSMDALLEP